ncbi:MAG TPA: erythromycin esterase family protein [Candidatus Cybelea sp.]|nr:erythromycin esterase family protein [Candidatus Cybelea sp.]
MRRTARAVVLAVAFAGAICCAAAAVDSRVAYLRLHAVTVRSISPDDRDFSDLEPLRQAIGSRQIVMLGEESHGDGATFLAKTRLIEFLHERMGFNVLAFESGFYDMHRAWEDLTSGTDSLQAIRSGVFGIWTNSQQTQPLWRYIGSQSRTAKPLLLAGIDSQFTSTASTQHFLADFNEVLDDLPQDSQLVSARTRAASVLASYFAIRGKGRAGLASFQKETTIADRALFYIALEKIRARLEKQEYSDPLKAARRDYWVQALASTSKLMEWLWEVDFKNVDDDPKAKINYAAFNLRDQQMGENLVWLAHNEFAGQKIIVWAATSHEMRHREYFTTEYTGYIPMGDWVNRLMGASVYTIGFTAFEGKAGVGVPWDIGVAAPGSLESLIHDTGEEYVFLDYRHLDPTGYWLTDPQSCRALGYQATTADWPATMDGLFYINTMTPSTQVPR